MPYTRVVYCEILQTTRILLFQLLANLATPLYLDVHKRVKGVTAKDLAEAHKKDLAIEGKYGAKFLRYWVDEKNETIFCLVDAQNAEVPTKVHREAHGLVPDETHEVKEGS